MYTVDPFLVLLARAWKKVTKQSTTNRYVMHDSVSASPFTVHITFSTSLKRIIYHFWVHRSSDGTWLDLYFESTPFEDAEGNKCAFAVSIWSCKNELGVLNMFIRSIKDLFGPCRNYFYEINTHRQ